MNHIIHIHFAGKTSARTRCKIRFFVKNHIEARDVVNFFRWQSSYSDKKPISISIPFTTIESGMKVERAKRLVLVKWEYLDSDMEEIDSGFF